MKVAMRTAMVAALAAASAGCGGGAGPAGEDSADAAALRELDARLAAAESVVADASVYQAILDNELQYTRALDRHEEALIPQSFWPDAKVSYGELVTIPDLGPWANEGHSRSAAHQHHVTTLNLDVSGDTAHEEGYILFSSDMKRDTSFDTEGAPTPGRALKGALTTLGTGRYVNRYERRDGAWRMIVHEYVNDVSMRLEPVDLCATGCLGRWDTSDISYARPLQALSVEERRARAELGKSTRAHKAP
jgi:hypothetical protein